MPPWDLAKKVSFHSGVILVKEDAANSCICMPDRVWFGPIQLLQALVWPAALHKILGMPDWL